MRHPLKGVEGIFFGLGLICLQPIFFRCGLSRSFRDLGTFCLGQSARDQVSNTLKSFYTAVSQLFRSWYNAS